MNPAPTAPRTYTGPSGRSYSLAGIHGDTLSERFEAACNIAARMYADRLDTTFIDALVDDMARELDA